VNRLARSAVLGCLAGALLLPAGAPSAFARDASTPSRGPDLGGYVFENVEERIEASFTIPRWTCEATDDGISTVVIATGTSDQLGGGLVQASCVNGHKRVRAALASTDGSVSPIRGKVRSRDVIDVSISLIDDNFAVNLSNRTRGWGAGFGGSASGHISTAVIGDQRLTRDGQVLAAPPFGTHAVGSLSLDGLPPAPADARRKSLRDDDGTVVIRPSRLEGDGSSFTLHSITGRTL
jgi:hypothetical protein